jgi:hypothetical protein
MEVTLGCVELGSAGGTQTYLLTMAEQLERLGHEATIYAESLGEMAELAQQRGIRVAGPGGELPPQSDALVARDAVAAAALAARYPDAPLVFVAASELFDFQQPPQLPGAVSALVALDDRVADRMRALALEPEVLRLRHPVDTDRFRPRAPLHDTAQRVLLLSNYLTGDRRLMFEEACSGLGVEVALVGADGETAFDPSEAINQADVVVGKARSILEGMACGRPAYIYDIAGSDGWVTPERYPLLEADGFAGRAEATARDADRVRRDLAEYRPELGQAGRDMVLANHLASRHAQELVRIAGGARKRRPAPRAPLREVERLVRVHARTELRAFGLARELEAVRRQAWADIQAARAEAEALRGTRRYRVAAALGSPLDRLRAFRRRRVGRRVRG